MTRGFRQLMQLDHGVPERGLIAARSMIAAGRTTDTRWRWVHSVHTTHLVDAEPGTAVEYRVERLRDTDHAATRLVRAQQGDRLLATTTVAFQTPRRELGHVHQDGDPGELPDPHSLPAAPGPGLLDVRYLDGTPNRMWVRFTEEIPDQVLLHAAAIVFAADLLLVVPGLDTGAGRAVPLDLSVRFHRGFRADDWVLHEHRTPSIADHRAYTTGQFHSSMGRLIASVSQETALLPAVTAGEGDRDGV